MKTLQKILVVLTIIICAIAVLPQNVSLAASAGDYINGITEGSTNTEYVSGLQTIIGNILSFLQVASALAAVVMIAVLGFNFITSTPEVKGEAQKKFVPIIVGIILVFGATSIAKFVLGIVGA